MAQLELLQFVLCSAQQVCWATYAAPCMPQAQSLREIFSRHSHLFKDVGGEYDFQKAATCKSIREFDEAITRVSFGEMECAVEACA